MVEYVLNPPDASSLMMSARSFGNYDLPAAIADLIDNSIKARANRVSITCTHNEGDPEVRILDDGEGMRAEELSAAMRPASTSPSEERSPDDLGRFGWGMKSASFSQCRKLIVLSNDGNSLSGAAWDLDDLDGWKMGILSRSEIGSICDPSLNEGCGTEVIWSKCDRLSEDGTIARDEFNALVAYTRDRLALTFHRYISGSTKGGRKLELVLNGQLVPAVDPFYRDHPATQSLETETLDVGDAGRITIRPYILPHYSKLRRNDLDRLSGEEGMVRNQGFYIYRNDRLVMYGTWFRLLRHGELSQLVRIAVDIPNTVDSMWKITVDKSDAQLPGFLRARLKQITAGLRRRASKVQRSKGGRMDPAGGIQPVWNRYKSKDEIRYEINRDHPLVRLVLERSQSEAAALIQATFRMVEREFPAESFSRDAADSIDSLSQAEANPDAFRDLLACTLPQLLVTHHGDVTALVQTVKSVEPYASNWPVVEDFLAEEGWI